MSFVLRYPFNDINGATDIKYIVVFVSHDVGVSRFHIEIIRVCKDTIKFGKGDSV